MIIVHDIFVCKPGNASKLAKMFKEAMAGTPGQNNIIMTDLTGQYNRVVVVSQHESLAVYEQMFAKMSQDTEENKKMAEAMKGYQDMYISGSREIYKTW